MPDFRGIELDLLREVFPPANRGIQSEAFRIDEFGDRPPIARPRRDRQ